MCMKNSTLHIDISTNIFNKVNIALNAVVFAFEYHF